MAGRLLRATGGFALVRMRPHSTNIEAAGSTGSTLVIASTLFQSVRHNVTFINNDIKLLLTAYLDDCEYYQLLYHASTLKHHLQLDRHEREPIHNGVTIETSTLSNKGTSFSV